MKMNDKQYFWLYICLGLVYIPHAIGLGMLLYVTTSLGFGHSWDGLINALSFNIVIALITGLIIYPSIFLGFRGLKAVAAADRERVAALVVALGGSESTAKRKEIKENRIKDKYGLYFLGFLLLSTIAIFALWVWDIRPLPPRPDIVEGQYVYIRRDVRVTACPTYARTLDNGIRDCVTTQQLIKGTRIEVAAIVTGDEGNSWWIRYDTDDGWLWIPATAVSDTEP